MAASSKHTKQLRYLYKVPLIDDNNLVADTIEHRIPTRQTDYTKSIQHDIPTCRQIILSQESQVLLTFIWKHLHSRVGRFSTFFDFLKWVVRKSCEYM